MAWTPEELQVFDDTIEIDIAPGGSGGRGGFPVWVVRVGDDLYTRSWKGKDGSWYRKAMKTGTLHVSAGSVSREVTLTRVDDLDDAVDDSYRRKYATRPYTFVAQMIAPLARETTVRLDPR